MTKRFTYLEYGGKSYKLSLSTGAEINFEKLTDTPFLEFINRVGAGVPFTTHVIRMLFVMINDSDKTFRQKDAEKMVGKMGVLTVLRPVLEAIKMAKPELSDDDDSEESVDEEDLGEAPAKNGE